MNKQLLRISLLLSFILVISSAYAGAGIKYGIESANINDELKHCVQYGLYNPWSTNTTLVLAAAGEIEKFALDTEEIFVQARTMHDKAIVSEICFIPEVFSKECVVGEFLCRKECSAEVKTFHGEIYVTELKPTSVPGTGSSALAVASAPLTLNVICQPYERNWWPLIIILAAVLIAIAAFLIIRQLRKPVTRAKKLKKYRKMQEKLRKIKRQIK